MDNGERSFLIQFRYYPDEPVATTDPVETEDVVQTPPGGDPVQAADATDTVADATENLAERRKLPDVARQPAEVTDEWAAQAGTDDEGEPR